MQVGISFMELSRRAALRAIMAPHAAMMLKDADGAERVPGVPLPWQMACEPPQPRGYPEN